ncbi:hypothetical protein [Leptothoe sp. PORK10 BA2]|nr:hypothetical protein [Leptothoe sp. PORK10 BA2]
MNKFCHQFLNDGTAYANSDECLNPKVYRLLLRTGVVIVCDR